MLEAVRGNLGSLINREKTLYVEPKIKAYPIQ